MEGDRELVVLLLLMDSVGMCVCDGDGDGGGLRVSVEVGVPLQSWSSIRLAFKAINGISIQS